MIIRPEEKQDFNEIYTVVKAAFATAEHSDGNEQDLVLIRLILLNGKVTIMLH